MLPSFLEHRRRVERDAGLGGGHRLPAGRLDPAGPREDITAFTAFPREGAGGQAIIRLAGAVLAGQNDERAESCR
ncbi:MAG TPA: hypothetical protein VKU77_05290 [Streptosporangiaceae bacterium]|nr:hypothetical protein [Streptosporangiaceae bacterium]